jgi:hypothetical protein
MDALERQQVARVNTIAMLESNFIRLGRPPFDPRSASFWKFMEILVDTWHIGYPLEVLEWIDTRQTDLATEKTLTEQVKGGLHKSFAIPSSLFKLIKAYWPDGEMVDKTFGNKFRVKFPLFKNSKY